VTDIVNGLAVTPTRRAFCRAVNERGRVVFYRHYAHAYDNKTSMRVTARLKETHSAGWIEPIPDDELWPGAMSKEQGLVYYRLTDYGRIAMRGAKNSIEEKNA
jgi:hypothetical protein